MNNLNPGPLSVASLDVARLAGVSRSAVSRTFTPGASVSQKTRTKVEHAATELGYRDNFVARGLDKKRTELVGMIASDMTNPYRSEQISAPAKRLVNEGFRPMLFCIDQGMNAEQLLSILLNYQVSGVIINSDAPLVDRIDDLPFVDYINGDDRKGGRMAAEELMMAGRRELVAVRPEKIGYSGDARIAAFTERASEDGIPQASWAFAKLTTIKQSVDEFAKITVNTLKTRINTTNAAPQKQVVDVRIVRRGTI